MPMGSLPLRSLPNGPLSAGMTKRGPFPLTRALRARPLPKGEVLPVSFPRFPGHLDRGGQYGNRRRRDEYKETKVY